MRRDRVEFPCLFRYFVTRTTPLRGSTTPPHQSRFSKKETLTFFLESQLALGRLLPTESLTEILFFRVPLKNGPPQKRGFFDPPWGVPKSGVPQILELWDRVLSTGVDPGPKAIREKLWGSSFLRIGFGGVGSWNPGAGLSALQSNGKDKGILLYLSLYIHQS